MSKSEDRSNDFVSSHLSWLLVHSISHRLGITVLDFEIYHSIAKIYKGSVAQNIRRMVVRTLSATETWKKCWGQQKYWLSAQTCPHCEGNRSKQISIYLSIITLLCKSVSGSIRPIINLSTTCRKIYKSKRVWYYITLQVREYFYHIN